MKQKLKKAYRSFCNIRCCRIYRKEYAYKISINKLPPP